MTIVRKTPGREPGALHSRIVFAGSCAQYDWSIGTALSETDTPRRPATRYGKAKQEASELVSESGATAIVNAVAEVCAET